MARNSLEKTDISFVDARGKSHSRASEILSEYLYGMLRTLWIVRVKVRDSNPIKFEGNPFHPVNRGKLCLRGQASLMRLYDKERLKQPMLRVQSRWVEISWKDAYSQIVHELKDSLDDRLFGPVRNFLITNDVSGSLSSLLFEFCQQLRFTQVPGFTHQPHAALRSAYRKILDYNAIPQYNIEKADFLLTIGADILYSFFSPVEHARKFAEAWKKGGKWTHIESNLTLSGTKAQRRLLLFPGSEVYLLRYLFHQLSSKFRKKLDEEIVKSISPITFEETIEKTGLDGKEIQKIVSQFSQAKAPLLIIAENSLSHKTGLEAAYLATALQWGLGMFSSTVDFSQGKDCLQLGSFTDLDSIEPFLHAKEVGVLFFLRSNVQPYFSRSLDFRKARFCVGLSEFKDETMEQCNLILPLHHFLESFSDVQPRYDIFSLIQPVVTPMYNTKYEGDIFLDLLRLCRKEKFTKYLYNLNFAGSWEQYSFENWAKIKDPKDWQRGLEALKKNEGTSLELFDKLRNWVKILRKGFYQRRSQLAKTSFHKKNFLQFFQKEANQNPNLQLPICICTQNPRDHHRPLPLIQEIPDSLSSISYGEYILVHPETAKSQNLQDGEVVKLQNGDFSIKAPVKLHHMLQKDTWVYPFYTKAVKFCGIDKRCGEQNLYFEKIQVQKTNDSDCLPVLAGEMFADGLGILPQDQKEKYFKKIHHVKLRHEKPLHPQYRWAMAIDLDLCMGCSACVAACYLENSIPIVGKKEHLKGREMAWIRIEPYLYEKEGQKHLQFIPMMCQQCEYAPCEPVCPVYATYHSEDGLNAQVYTRCVGSRYCTNNCPYKVRVFNWFQHVWPSPLNKILNPDVTHRKVGVAEKCTFCLQRIREGKETAKMENRIVKDGEIQPACVQTCPTGALVFGNLLDKNSKIYKLSQSKRSYRILEEIGVEPAIYYLHGWHGSEKE